MDLAKSVAARCHVNPARGSDVCPGGSRGNLEVYQLVPEETEWPEQQSCRIGERGPQGVIGLQEVWRKINLG